MFITFRRPSDWYCNLKSYKPKQIYKWLWCKCVEIFKRSRCRCWNLKPSKHYWATWHQMRFVSYDVMKSVKIANCYIYPEIRWHKASQHHYLEQLNNPGIPVIKVMTRPQVPVRREKKLPYTYLDITVIYKYDSCILAGITS